MITKDEFEEIELEFDFKAFNPNFHHLEREFANQRRRFIWLYGGSSSAKSYSLAQATICISCLVEGSDTLVFRKVSATLESTIFKDFVTVINKLGLQQFFKVQYRKITCVNGAVVDFKGLDDEQKIKGISGYKRVIMDEISEMEHKDFKQIRKRLRGRAGQQIICAFNPIDEEHWIKKEIFDKESESRTMMSNSLIDRNGVLKLDVSPEYTEVSEKWEGRPINLKGKEYPPNMVVIKSTYLNNFWVMKSPCGTFGFYDLQTIVDFEQDKKDDYDFYCIYALGNWGKLNKGGEMYKKFDTKRHVRDNIKWNQKRSLHLTFDENVNPYMTLGIWQGNSDLLKAWKIGEICLEDPRNTLDHTLNEFIDRYPNNELTIFIYGDATSKKADVKQEKGVNFFTLIENKLKRAGYTVVNRVPASNPSVELRCNWLDKVLDGLDDIEVTFSDECVKTIDDFKYLKQASDGTKHKEKVKNKTTGVTYEKYGHNTDADEYFLTRFFNVSYARFGEKSGLRKATIVKRKVKKSY